MDYEFGVITARTYRVGSLPEESQLVEDLHRFISLYALALDARESKRLEGSDAIVTSPKAEFVKMKLLSFKPKSAEDYKQLIVSRELVKSRKHELLVNDYQRFLTARRFAVSSPHPRDLVAERGSTTLAD